MDAALSALANIDAPMLAATQAVADDIKKLATQPMVAQRV
jgi:hypothetical protein